MKTPFSIYLSVPDTTITSILMQEAGREQKPIYFVSKTLQVLETQHQNLEQAALVVVFTTRRLRYYVHNYKVIVRIYLRLHHMFKKIDLAGRMMK